MIIVDGVTQYETKLRHKKWSHMISTVSADELHHMAQMIGLRREWFQSGSFDHYDVTPSKRAKAIALGAYQGPTRAILFLNYDYERRRQVRPCVDCAAKLQPVPLHASVEPGAFVPNCVRCDRSLYERQLTR